MSTPPRLGRGLAALLAEDRTSAPPSLLAIDALAPGPFQPRGAMKPGALTDLTESIRRQGVLQPLLVRADPARPGFYQIIAGERRWRASSAAGLREVPVLIRQFSDTEAMAAALVENLQRDDLNPMEEAEGYQRLMREFKVTQDDLAGTVGKSRSHISNTLRLLQATPGVRKGVEGGTLTAGHARALLNHANPDWAARKVIARGLNVRQTEAYVSRIPTPPRPAKARVARSRGDLETNALARSVGEHLGLRVEMSWDGKGGTIQIHYKGLEQLESVCVLLMDGKLPAR